MSRLTRRDVIWLGSGLAAGALGLRWLDRLRAPAPSEAASQTPAHLAGNAARYGHGVAPPASLDAQSLDALTLPPVPASGRAPRTIPSRLEVVDQVIPVADGQTMRAYTFGGSVPGPVLRAREGDTLEITLENRSTEPHNLHFHGRHAVSADGWEPIRPGGRATYRLEAAPFGLHPYHCDMTPTADHIGNGLFGALIVDPPGGRPPAHERVLVLGGFDVNGDGESELCGWNGVAGFFVRYPIKVPAGELVRLYVVNMLVEEPLVSFHLHAQTFDVYRTGSRLTPDEHTDVVSLGPTERAILELRLPEPGRYMFHPHQRRLAETGAMGWLVAV